MSRAPDAHPPVVHPSVADPTVDGIPLARLAASPHRRPVERPVPQPAEPPNLWNVLRDAAGNDLSRMAIPVYFNEPLSFLQRVAEDVEYSHLLDSAAHPSLVASPDRLALVAAFMISHYSSTAARVAKPFNPLLGETFDLVAPDRGIALVAEQVSHHPPTSALFVQGRGWTYSTAHEINNRFLGNTLEVWPEGTVHIHFRDGDHYVYDQVRTQVHNIVMGQLWLDNAGTATIREVTHGKYIASIKFKRNTLLFREAKRLGDISGKITSASTHPKSTTVLRKITGNWRSDVKVDGKLVWTAAPRPLKTETGGHNFTAWAWRLNSEVQPHTHPHSLPITDSRLRPDQRALEKGLHKLAHSEKERLEEAQRKRRKDSQHSERSHSPRWFQLRYNHALDKKEWMYVHNYFATKHTASAPWPDGSPHIF